MITQPQIPEELFHYCPTNSFHGIISSKQLWLSNLEYSNDPDENLIAFKILDAISKDHKNDAIKNFAKEIIDSNHPMMGYPSTCVFCMSRVPDHLGQWREYADNGFGFMIGISTKYFLDHGLWTLFNPKVSIPLFDKVFLAECIYDPEEQRSIIEILLNDFLVNDFFDKARATGLIKPIIKLYSSVFKHEAYSFEKEWRLICFPYEAAVPNIPKLTYEVYFRSRRQGIVRYVKEHLNKVESPNISIYSITIGPNIFNEEVDVMTFLINKGIQDVLTIQSKINMRDTK
jgi:hypothetical protein